MNARRFDLITRHAARSISRRGSLMTLSTAAVGAALTRSLPAEARKRRKKGSKRRKKRCRREKKKCRRAVKNYCGERFILDPEECEAFLLPCCRSCKPKQVLLCVVNVTE